MNKKQIHKHYDEIAVKVFRGELGYKPSVKSKYSKSSSLKFNHKIEFK